MSRLSDAALINRAEFIVRACSMCGTEGCDPSSGKDDEVCHFIKMLRDEPAVDAVPVVRGRWMQRANGEVYCSHCNCTVGVGNLDDVTEEEYYCYNCGARMDGTER